MEALLVLFIVILYISAVYSFHEADKLRKRLDAVEREVDELRGRVESLPGHQ